MNGTTENRTAHNLQGQHPKPAWRHLRHKNFFTGRQHHHHPSTPFSLYRSAFNQRNRTSRSYKEICWKELTYMIVATGEATLKSGGQVLGKDRPETLKHKQKLLFTGRISSSGKHQFCSKTFHPIPSGLSSALKTFHLIQSGLPSPW